MQSLLERLRRRLRELGHPRREFGVEVSQRQNGRVDVGEAPQRRTEVEPTRPRTEPDIAATTDSRQLPQQPPAPAASRVKAAVFAKQRRSAMHPPPTTIGGCPPLLWFGGETEQAEIWPKALTTSSADPQHRTWPDGQAHQDAPFLWQAQAIDGTPSSRPVLSPQEIYEPIDGPLAAAPQFDGGLALDAHLEGNHPVSETRWPDPDRMQSGMWFAGTPTE